MTTADFMTLEQASARLLIAGKSVPVATLRRWCRVGVRGHVLRHGEVARRIVVTEADVIAFVYALGAQGAPEALETRRSSASRAGARSAQASACMKRLAAKGVR